MALDVADLKPEGQLYVIPARLEECALPKRFKMALGQLSDADGYDRLRASLDERAASL